MPPAEGNNPSAPYNVPFRHVLTTWGDIKALNARAKEILVETKVEDTPENRLIAYLAVLSANQAKTLLLIAIILCLVGQGLATEVNSSYIYWGHIIDPPVFKLHTWWNVEPPFSTNDTEWTGGMWMPPDGPLEENKHWLPVPKNTVYAAEHLPVCFSVLINTLCFPLKEQLYAADKEQHSDYYQLSMVARVGLHTHKGVYHTSNPSPVPPCTLDTSR